MTIERKKLTQTTCEKAQPNSKIWDTDVKGSGLFTGKARKTFYYQRDMHGKTVRIKIGNWTCPRASDLLCMSNLAPASPTKEHDDNDDFQGTTG